MVVLFWRAAARTRAFLSYLTRKGSNGPKRVVIRRPPNVRREQTCGRDTGHNPVKRRFRRNRPAEPRPVGRVLRTRRVSVTGNDGRRGGPSLPMEMGKLRVTDFAFAPGGGRR